MRYSNIPNITYTRDFLGESKDLKNQRVFTLAASPQRIPRKEGQDLDAVATVLFGKNQESRWYQIAEANADYIIAYKAELSNIPEWRVPVRR